MTSFSLSKRLIMLQRINLILILFVLLCDNLINPRQIFASDNIITVYNNQEIGTVNKMLYGDNVLGYDPYTYESWGGTPDAASTFVGFKDFGAGIWNSGSTGVKGVVPTVINLAKGVGSSVWRFPGGTGSICYDWRNAIGPGRTHFLFGIDEWLTSCNAAGTIPLFTLAYFSGSIRSGQTHTPVPASLSANLVEYLNSPNDGNHPWAATRAANGHPAPYGVKYFEMGNEIIAYDTPTNYANNYLSHYNAIKAVDPTAQVGLVVWENDYKQWNNTVLPIVKGNLDFIIFHVAPSYTNQQTPPTTDSATTVFSNQLAEPIVTNERLWQTVLPKVQSYAGKSVPIAATEYDSGQFGTQTPYFYSLGTALINAELLRLFMKPQNNVFMATNWALSNCFGGMTMSEVNMEYIYHNYSTPPVYFKRPNYYIRQLYHDHFGDTLLAAGVTSATYTYTSTIWPYTPTAIPYLTVNASKSADGNKLYLMVVNKDMFNSRAASISLSNFVPSSSQTAYILNGPSVDATNETSGNRTNVNITQQPFTINSQPFYFTFPAHSVTAIELTR